MSIPRTPRVANSQVPLTARDARDGRVLVECLLALTLLSVAALALGAGTRGVATLADDAVLVARTHSVLYGAAERALAAPCTRTPNGTTALPAGPRLSAEQRTDRQGATLARVVTAQLFPSPLSLRNTQQLSLSAARPCD